MPHLSRVKQMYSQAIHLTHELPTISIHRLSIHLFALHVRDVVCYQQGAQAKMGKIFEGVFCPNNRNFKRASWHHWKALCIHFQKLVFVLPHYYTWRSYEGITGATSNFYLPFFDLIKI